MDQNSEIKGSLTEVDISEVISQVIKHDLNNCSIRFILNGFSINIYIKKNKIIFIQSDNPRDSFFEYLKNNSDLNEADLKKALSDREKNGFRLGKILVEQDLINYDELWSYVLGYQKHLLNVISAEVSGEYEIEENPEDIKENITLDIPVGKFILERIRNKNIVDSAREKFEMMDEVFLKNRNPKLPDDMHPFELHVLDLCLKYRNLNKILELSELKEEDTLKYIYYYYLIDVISTEKFIDTSGQTAKDYLSVNISFSSYEEALKHYNIKFEMIYKILSKEIGPVAMSILTKSIDDIRENLPVFLKGAEIDKNGRLLDKKILKKVWYHDYETHSSGFVRGLEELLYAQIYAVKKNLGIDYENQILRWLKGTGN